MDNALIDDRRIHVLLIFIYRLILVNLYQNYGINIKKIQMDYQKQMLL